MTDFNDIKRRLEFLVENRNYFFRDTTKQAAEKYLDKKINFKGLSDLEIDQLENGLRKSFPLDFKQYLALFGRNCGDLFCRGQDIEPYNILEYQKWAIELINEQEMESFLTSNSIVFFFHEGYSFFYFEKTEENTSIYLFVEGDSKPKKMFDSFSEMLENELLQLERVHKKESELDGYFITINDEFEHREIPAKSSGIQPRKVGDIFIQ